jgi:hypothetical protein
MQGSGKGERRKVNGEKQGETGDAGQFLIADRVLEALLCVQPHADARERTAPLSPALVRPFVRLSHLAFQIPPSRTDPAGSAGYSLNAGCARRRCCI